jgi:hypothetical protein
MMTLYHVRGGRETSDRAPLARDEAHLPQRAEDLLDARPSLERRLRLGRRGRFLREDGRRSRAIGRVGRRAFWREIRAEAARPERRDAGRPDLDDVRVWPPPPPLRHAVPGEGPRDAHVRAAARPSDLSQRRARPVQRRRQGEVDRRAHGVIVTLGFWHVWRDLCAGAGVRVGGVRDPWMRAGVRVDARGGGWWA